MKRLSAPEFWWHRHSLAGMALAPAGMIYGQIAGRRMARPGVSVSIPILCVGNLVVGGAGKTPLALEVARTCRKLGLGPGFLTRGYRGRESGPLIVSQAIHSAHDVGDEALLLAQAAPTVVASDRPSGAKLLASLGVDLVIMDDGFQNPSLRKDLALVVVDERGAGNGHVLPAGPLRAPIAQQMRVADALVVLGEGAGGRIVRVAARAGLPVLHAKTESARRRGLRRRPYLAFAGIGNPAKFFETLTAAGAVVEHTMGFPDHHVFTHEECEAILAEAKSRNLVPITTEKDRVRLSRGSDAVERLAAAAETLPIHVVFEEPKRLSVLIEDAVAAHASAYRQKRPVIARGEETTRARATR